VLCDLLCRREEFWNINSTIMVADNLDGGVVTLSLGRDKVKGED
jgi:hypothetical protein